MHVPDSEYLRTQHRPEGVLALSTGLIALGAVTLYRAARRLWRQR